MRFCHVTTYYPPWNFGGDGIATRMICEGLARRGHQVDVVHCADAYMLRGSPVTDLPADPPGIHRHIVRSRFGALSPLVTQQTGRPGLKRRQLRRILSQPYDVVHFHNVSLIGGPGVIPLSRAPVTLYTTHDHWLFCPAHVLWKNRSKPCDRPTCLTCSIRSGIPPQLWRYTRLAQRCLQQVDALLCPSEYTAKRHRQAGFERPVEVHRWYSRMGARPARPAAIRPSPAGESSPLFVFAGRLVASKGVEHLLQSIALRPHYRLLVAGDGPLLERLRRVYREFGHIRFVGRIAAEELEPVLRGARAVIVPSWGPEVCPLSVLEALACGTPAIVRRAGGSPEAVELTGGGLTYDHPEELLPLVDRLAADHALYERLSALASAGVQEHFTEDRWMDQYFRVIGDIAREKSANFASEPVPV